MSEWMIFAVSFTTILLCTGLALTFLEFHRANAREEEAKLLERAPNKRIRNTRAHGLNS